MMNNLLKNIILIIIISSFNGSLFSKSIQINKIGPIKSDTSWIKVRMPSEKVINEFRSKKQFQYHRENKFKQILESINKRINDFFSRLFKDANIKAPEWVNLQNIILIFSLIIFIFISYMVLTSNLGGLFFRKRNEIMFGNEISIENIEEIDFDVLVQNFLLKEDYNMAVRMLYHKILKELSIAKIIKWKMDKTNNDYIQEINDELLKINFKELTVFFNFVWYGKFSIDKNEFNEINNKFKKFIHDIKTVD